jgi:hypothetical protein
MLDVGNLGGGEGRHLVTGVVAEKHVEIVEVAPRRAEDDGFPCRAHVIPFRQLI